MMMSHNEGFKNSGKDNRYSISQIIILNGDTVMKNLYETLGGTYHEENGHLIPNVTLPEQTDYQIGKYGRMHLDHIKQHRRGRYTTLLTEGKLNARLHEIDLEANEMLETIIPRLAIERGIDEDLKARDMLRWVAEMNNIKTSAEEIVLQEVVLV